MPVAVHVVDHPLIADSLTRVRDVATPNALFRQELERIGTLLMAAPADALVASASCIAGSVWHPPPDRVLPLLCILTV